jgi:predicted transposase YbfD/YdcC
VVFCKPNNIGTGGADQKSNEITAIAELLSILDINGCIVTIDAMGCQKKISGQIVDQGGDYVLALKGNQGAMHEDIKLFFEDALKIDFKDIKHEYFETINGDHGRVEIRRHWTVDPIDWIEDKDKWKKLNMIGMVQSERHVDEEISIENRFYISSLRSEAECFANAVRQHWSIENSCHWTLDVAFREDDCRKRKGNCATNFSKIRRIALNLLKNDKSIKAGVKAKRKVAGWDNEYLEKLIS